MFFEWMKETRLSEWIMKQEKKVNIAKHIYYQIYFSA